MIHDAGEIAGLQADFRVTVMEHYWLGREIYNEIDVSDREQFMVEGGQLSAVDPNSIYQASQYWMNRLISFYLNHNENYIILNRHIV
jgi:hypothetical protein